jgi:hypothetical protein
MVQQNAQSEMCRALALVMSKRPSLGGGRRNCAPPSEWPCVNPAESAARRCELRKPIRRPAVVPSVLLASVMYYLHFLRR